MAILDLISSLWFPMGRGQFGCGIFWEGSREGYLRKRRVDIFGRGSEIPRPCIRRPVAMKVHLIPVRIIQQLLPGIIRRRWVCFNRVTPLFFLVFNYLATSELVQKPQDQIICKVDMKLMDRIY